MRCPLDDDQVLDVALDILEGLATSPFVRVVFRSQGWIDARLVRDEAQYRYALSWQDVGATHAWLATLMRLVAAGRLRYLAGSRASFALPASAAERRDSARDGETS